MKQITAPPIRIVKPSTQRTLMVGATTLRVVAEVVKKKGKALVVPFKCKALPIATVDPSKNKGRNAYPPSTDPDYC